MDLKLKDKVALVTGGSHGIGKSICLSLAEEGCHIAFCARGKRYDVVKAAAEILSRGVMCHVLEADVSVENDVKAIISSTLQRFFKIDILVNNVGGGSSWGNETKWESTSASTWQAIYMQSFHSTVMMTNLILPHMLENKFGRVISISSIVGKENGGMPWYQSAKSAQISFMKSYASNPEYVRNGITFNTICPGFVDMPDKKQERGLEKNIPMGRFGVPDDISPIVTFLCSEKSNYINGSCIVVDGGYTKSF